MISGIWKWFNGKKALIGLTMLWLSDRIWLKEFIPDGPIEGVLIDTLIFVGGALAGVGIVHKIFKASDNKPYSDEFKST